MGEYILDVGVFQALDWLTIARYLFVLGLEIFACVYLTWFYAETVQRPLRQRLLLLSFSLFVLSLFFKTPELYYGWYIVTVIVTGVFANSRFGFSWSEFIPHAPIKIPQPLRNLLMWLLLVIMSYSLSLGSSLLVTIARRPQVEQKVIWFILPEKDGDMFLAFKDMGYSPVRVPKEYNSHLEEGDCIEITYYAPYDPVGYLDNFATQIRKSDQCVGEN